LAAQSSSVGRDQALKAALDLLRRGHVDQAVAVYRRILEAIPDDVDAVHYLGLALFQKGRHDEGIALVTRAIDLAPDYVDAQNNLGNMLVERGRPAEAEARYLQVLTQHPDHPDARVNLGALLARRNERAAAETEFRRVLAAQPRHAEAIVNLGLLLQHTDRRGEALAMFEQALALRPHEGASFRRLGTLLQSLGRIADAAAIFARWLAVEPDNAAARHLLASCSGQDVPVRAADAFVQDTFDAFADSFDQVLDKLQYRAPALILDAVAQTVGAATASLDVLDAGAGTGWCGPSLRPYARRLMGVDLSPKMLEKASQRGVYDALITAELVAYMRANVDAFDLIISADTLVYFGALDEALSAAAASLRAAGHLIFTVERANDEPVPPFGYRLNPHGRYSHTEDYLRRTLSDSGLTLQSLSAVHLRLQSGVPVMGMLVIAHRPSATS